MTQKRPEFVAREGYRQRRRMDAARLLPLLGIFLFLLPVLWPGGHTRSGYIYLFGIWIGLIGLAAVLSSRLIEPDTDAGEGDEKEPVDGSV